MAFRTAILAISTLLVAAPAALAANWFGGTETPRPQEPVGEEKPVEFAQMREFHVYIDGLGREVVVDPRTGKVVEIRPPGRITNDQGWERLERRQGEIDRRRVYDFTQPGERERYRRDREAELGLREPPPPDDPYELRPLPRGQVRIGPDGFPEAPGNPGADVRRLAPPIEDRSVRRESLEPPEPREGSPSFEQLPDEEPLFEELPEGELAAVPEDESGQADGLPETPSGNRAPLLSDDDVILQPGERGAREDVAKFQVLLDRAGASPGVIDGRIGDNVNNAIDSYKRITGQSLRTYDKDWIEKELEATGGPAFTEYTITPEDGAGPYIASVPEDYGEKATLERLGYTSVSEMLAERFHMDEEYLKALNPGVHFNRAGTVIRVVNPGANLDPKKNTVARLVADKSREQVLAYDEGGRLIASYPATIGSKDTPSPSGTHTVARIAFDPEYTYDPKKNFKQGDNDKVLTIPPGPNGPVGTIWIALSKPTYGIHGTPEPSKIGKTASHGCVRLTNWDAQELAKMVKEGTEVAFVE